MFEYWLRNKKALYMLYRMYRQTRSKNTNEKQNAKLWQYKTKKAALDITRAVTAKLWYKVIKDVQRIKQYKCCAALAENIERWIDVRPGMYLLQDDLSLHVSFKFLKSLKRGMKFTLASIHKTARKCASTEARSVSKHRGTQGSHVGFSLGLENNTSWLSTV